MTCIRPGLSKSGEEATRTRASITVELKGSYKSFKKYIYKSNKSELN